VRFAAQAFFGLRRIGRWVLDFSAGFSRAAFEPWAEPAKGRNYPKTFLPAQFLFLI
jgi:hypothetical protein